MLLSRDAVPAPLPEHDANAAGEMLVLAQHARLLDFDPRDRDACVTADENVIESCRHLLAVWDGSWSTGSDRTAHLVAYARGRGVPVEVLWPPGAARTGGVPVSPGTGAACRRRPV